MIMADFLSPLKRSRGWRGVSRWRNKKGRQPKPRTSDGFAGANAYGFCAPLVAGDSAFGCGVFGATLLPLKPKIRITISMQADTMPHINIDVAPALELSSPVIAMTISPISVSNTSGMGKVSHKNEAAGRSRRPSEHLMIRA
jgi:hypothetical protein